MKYVKKPVTIEAVSVREVLTAAIWGWEALPDWIRAACDAGTVGLCGDFVVIHALEGDMLGGIDDMIIQGVKGELYPCKPDIFNETYSPVNSPERGEEG